MEIYGVCFDYHRSEHEAGVRLEKGVIQITQAKQASQRSFRPKNTSRCSSCPYGRTNGAAEYWQVINRTRHGMPSALCPLPALNLAVAPSSHFRTTSFPGIACFPACQRQHIYGVLGECNVDNCIPGLVHSICDDIIQSWLLLYSRFIT